MTTVAGVAVSPDHFIGGERVASDERFEDRSPIDEQVLAEVARGREREVGLAVDAAATRSRPGRRSASPGGPSACAASPT